MNQLQLPLEPLLINGGTLEIAEDSTIRLALPSDSKKYCDAQLDDYHSIPRKQFLWSPPCRMTIRAYASHPDPTGTLGFGFWNDPFTISIGQAGTARRLPVTPQTIWFFYGSKENDICLNPDLPGSGWKASCIRSPKVPALLLAPAAALGMAVSTIPFLRSWIVKIIQRMVKTNEAMLHERLDQWHTYSIEWRTDKVIFSLDGNEVLNVNDPPDGPLGFVAWIDNQFALLTPRARFRFGIAPTLEKQWLELEIKHLTAG